MNGIEAKKGPKRAQWIKYFSLPGNAGMKEELFNCYKGGDVEVSKLSTDIEALYGDLSSGIHQPAVKMGEGKYRIPIPADLSHIHQCILEKISKTGLKWNVYFIAENDENAEY